MLFVVFDVESVGLHGEGFAVGATVVDSDRPREELDSLFAACPPGNVSGDREARAWLVQHLPPLEYHYQWAKEMGTVFWMWWKAWEARGARLAADCPWPVETNFLRSCVLDNVLERKTAGPYPLIDVASVRLAAGLDPIATEPRLAREIPLHDPLADARQSARLLLEALARIHTWRESTENLEAALPRLKPPTDALVRA